MDSTVLERRHGIARGLMTIYGIAAYAAFLALLVSVVGFVEGLAVPRGIDDGSVASTPVAVAVNLALLALFAVQHSVMARPWFKRWWTRFVPQAIERSTYVVASSAVLALLVWQWRAVPGTVWNVGGGPWRAAVEAVSFAGWALMLGSTFLIDHFDMFGVRQVVRHHRGQPQTSPPFQTRLLYRVVRHPLLLGLLIAVWAAPTMSLGHLLFAGAATVYIVLGARLEERDLTTHFGERYRRYRREVPMLVPGIRGPLDEEPGRSVGIARDGRRTGHDTGQALDQSPRRQRPPGTPRIGRDAPALEGASVSPADGAPAREMLPFRLVDGAQVLVRELLPSDEEAIRAFYRGLSPATLSRRFLTPYPSLPEPMLRYLAVAGRADRCVIVATHGGAIVGEARFHLADGSDGAEVAVVVADDWQGRGLGTELARRLVGLARARGLTAFTGSIRADNGAAVGLLASLAPAADRRRRSGELEFRAQLPVPRLPVSRPCAGCGRPGAISRADHTPARNSTMARASGSGSSTAGRRPERGVGVHRRTS